MGIVFCTSFPLSYEFLVYSLAHVSAGTSRSSKRGNPSQFIATHCNIPNTQTAPATQNGAIQGNLAQLRTIHAIANRFQSRRSSNKFLCMFYKLKVWLFGAIFSDLYVLLCTR